MKIRNRSKCAEKKEKKKLNMKNERNNKAFITALF